MKKIIFWCFILMISGCGIFKKKQKNDPDSSRNHVQTVSNSSHLDIKAKAHQLDVFEIGEPLNKIDLNSWNDYDKSQVDAGFFGFDGGGNALLYAHKNQPIAAVLKDQNQQEILAIVAIHPDIKTNEKISVQTSLESLQSAYPEGVLEEDQLNGWFHYVISAKKWKFVFDTTDQEKLNNIKSSFLVIH